ncbi:MAG: magnesium-translocating P-type ATPase, partial [Pseudomonas sp.]|nr:magnesium-translocating P-type ATPase [Pseudomonas sp.]
MKLSLKEFFAGFLRTRHIGRHFRRLVLLDSLTNTTVNREVPPTLAQMLVVAANSDSAVLIDNLGTHTDGLSDAEVDVLRDRHGLNEIEHEQPLSPWIHAWHCYKNPFNLLLTLLAAVSLATDDIQAAVVIGTMVV